MAEQKPAEEILPTLSRGPHQVLQLGEKHPQYCAEAAAEERNDRCVQIACPDHNPSAATGHSIHARCTVDVNNDPNRAHAAAFVPSRGGVNEARWPPLPIPSFLLILMGLKCFNG